MVRSLAFALLLAAGCHNLQTKTPELRVLGRQEAPQAHEVVYVQVSNPTSHTLRLTQLEYRFASSTNTTVSEGDLALGAREVPAGAAVVVEVPLDNRPSEEAMTLRGKLVAEQDHIIKTFKVSAQIQPMN